MFRKIVLALAAAATLGASALAPTAASAHWKGGFGHGFAIGGRVFDLLFERDRVHAYPPSPRQVAGSEHESSSGRNGWPEGMVACRRGDFDGLQPDSAVKGQSAASIRTVLCVVI